MEALCICVIVAAGRGHERHIVRQEALGAVGALLCGDAPHHHARTQRIQCVFASRHALRQHDSTRHISVNVEYAVQRCPSSPRAQTAHSACFAGRHAMHVSIISTQIPFDQKFS